MDKIRIVTGLVFLQFCVVSFKLHADQIGVASWYGPRFHGRRAASGEIFNQHQLTAAHRYLPMGTVAKVTNLENRKSVTVRINDRGPYAKKRILDLSRAAARALGLIKQGTALVRIEVVGPADRRLASASTDCG